MKENLYVILFDKDIYKDVIMQGRISLFMDCGVLTLIKIVKNTN